MAAGKAILDISLPALFEATACVPREGDGRGGGGAGTSRLHTLNIVPATVEGII